MCCVMELFVEQVSFKINEQTSLLASASKQEILTWTGELWEGWRSSGLWICPFLEHPWCFGAHLQNTQSCCRPHLIISE